MRRAQAEQRARQERQRQLTNSSTLINQAISQLGAQRSNMSCGHAEVRSSQLDAMKDGAVLQQTRFQDKMETRETNVLQDKLNADAPDYTVEVLGDWSPAIAGVKGDDFVDIDEAGNQPGMKLVEDLECAALDGARMMIFEVDDGSGNTSYKIGLEDSLFDDQGNWLNPEAKKAYDQFLAGALAAQRSAIDDDDKKPTRNRVSAAMRSAGLEEDESTKLPTGSTAIRFGTRVGEDVGRGLAPRRQGAGDE